jgi:regulator of replication initiation timing
MSYHQYEQKIKDLEEELLEKNKQIDNLKEKAERLEKENKDLKRGNTYLISICDGWIEDYYILENKLKKLNKG